jgi:predicted Zn-dependent peptidase
VLSLESTGARMNRLGSEILAGAPLEPLDEIVEKIDAVTLEQLGQLVEELWAPESRSAAAIGPDGERLADALEVVAPYALGEQQGATQRALGGA